MNSTGLAFGFRAVSGSKITWRLERVLLIPWSNIMEKNAIERRGGREAGSMQIKPRPMRGTM